MGIELANFEAKASAAVKGFWLARASAAARSLAKGTSDTGERAGVTSGKNMDGFAQLFADLVRANGLLDAEVYTDRKMGTLPGFFRPGKEWDVVVVRDGRLIAAIELKSHIGPSFSGNFNNRNEEAIGTAHDFWTAYRNKMFGDLRNPRPFVAWLILVEDAEDSRAEKALRAQHFSADSHHRESSYLTRYDILCQRMVVERLYTRASVIASPRTAITTGEYSEISRLTGLKSLVESFSAHIASEVASNGQWSGAPGRLL